MRQAIACSLIVAAACASGVGAMQVKLDRRSIERAVDIGGRADAERNRFHEPYIVQLGHPAVRSVEVVTEFRRVVIAKEEQGRIGNRFYGAREADEMLRPWRGRVSIVAHVQFNPQNVLVSVPAYQMTLEDPRDSKRLAPLEVRSNPIYASTRLVSADVEGIFDAGQIGQSRQTVILQAPPGQVVAAAIDFAGLE